MTAADSAGANDTVEWLPRGSGEEQPFRAARILGVSTSNQNEPAISTASSRRPSAIQRRLTAFHVPSPRRAPLPLSQRRSGSRGTFRRRRRPTPSSRGRRRPQRRRRRESSSPPRSSQWTGRCRLRRRTAPREATIRASASDSTRWSHIISKNRSPAAAPRRRPSCRCRPKSRRSRLFRRRGPARSRIARRPPSRAR